MYEKAKNYTLMRPRLKKTVGGTFVAVGFVSLAIPIIPGTLLLILGLQLLGIRFLLTDRLLGRGKGEVVS
jgi:hypothetical protein